MYMYGYLCFVSNMNVYVWVCLLIRKVYICVYVMYMTFHLENRKWNINTLTILFKKKTFSPQISDCVAIIDIFAYNEKLESLLNNISVYGEIEEHEINKESQKLNYLIKN